MLRPTTVPSYCLTDSVAKPVQAFRPSFGVLQRHDEPSSLHRNGPVISRLQNRIGPYCQFFSRNLCCFFPEQFFLSIPGRSRTTPLPAPQQAHPHTPSMSRSHWWWLLPPCPSVFKGMNSHPHLSFPFELEHRPAPIQVVPWAGITRSAVLTFATLRFPSTAPGFVQCCFDSELNHSCLLFSNT